MIARAAAVLLMLSSGAAAAATVYRCGPDGRTFAQQPCADGRAIEVGDARSASDRREGEAAAATQARAAQVLERQRSEAPPALSASRIDTRFKPPPDRATDREARRSKDFRAVDGPTRKKRRRSAG